MLVRSFIRGTAGNASEGDLPRGAGWPFPPLWKGTLEGGKRHLPSSSAVTKTSGMRIHAAASFVAPVLRINAGSKGDYGHQGWLHLRGYGLPS